MNRPSGGMEILAALEIKKMLVDRLVNLLSRGYVLPVVKYMAQCWRNTDTDISLIRSFVKPCCVRVLGACSMVRCEAAFSPTFSTTPFSPTFG